MAIRRLILASASPYRRELLQKSGVPIEAIAAVGDERLVQEIDGRRLAAGRARFKALDVARRCTAGDLVIGADQVVSCGDRIYDKANTLADAAEHLHSLAGRVHTLHSAVCLVVQSQVVEDFCVNLPMKMRVLSNEAQAAYLKRGEWQGCVGGYKIEGAGIQLFEPPIGDFFSIIGMPLAELFSALRRAGVDLLENPSGPWG